MFVPVSLTQPRPGVTPFPGPFAGEVVGLAGPFSSHYSRSRIWEWSQSLEKLIRRLGCAMSERTVSESHEHLHNIAPLHARPPDNKGVPGLWCDIRFKRSGIEAL